jgi:hypothetical protein
MPALNPTPHAAIVSRQSAYPKPGELFLRLDARGAPVWTDDPGAATAFESMREAARAALRLPAALRAYGLPFHIDIPDGQSLH